MPQLVSSLIGRPRPAARSARSGGAAAASSSARLVEAGPATTPVTSSQPRSAPCVLLTWTRRPAGPRSTCVDLADRLLEAPLGRPRLIASSQPRRRGVVPLQHLRRGTRSARRTTAPWKMSMPCASNRQRGHVQVLLVGDRVAASARGPCAPASSALAHSLTDAMPRRGRRSARPGAYCLRLVGLDDAVGDRRVARAPGEQRAGSAAARARARASRAWRGR